MTVDGTRTPAPETPQGLQIITIMSNFLFLPQVTMKTSPYLVILFLKILALTSLVSAAQNHPRIQRRQHQFQQQQPQQPQNRGGRLFREDLSKVRKNTEVFFINLEDGFFGCQVRTKKSSNEKVLIERSTCKKVLTSEVSVNQALV